MKRKQEQGLCNSEAKTPKRQRVCTGKIQSLARYSSQVLSSLHPSSPPSPSSLHSSNSTHSNVLDSLAAQPSLTSSEAVLQNLIQQTFNVPSPHLLPSGFSSVTHDLCVRPVKEAEPLTVEDKKNFPSQRCNQSAFLHYDAITRDYKITQFAGYEPIGFTGLNSMYEFSLQTNKWSCVEAELQERDIATYQNVSGRPLLPLSGQASCYDPVTQCMFLFGGISGFESLNHFYSYDPRTRHWFRMGGVKPSPRCNHQMILCAKKRKMYMFGGQSSILLGSVLGDLHEYCLKTFRWNRLLTGNDGESKTKQNNNIVDNRKVPCARSRHRMEVVGNEERYVLLFGGGVGGMWAKYCFNDLWQLDLETMEWKELETTGHAPSPREAHSTTVIGMNRDKMVVYGGSNQQFFIYDDFYVLDWPQATWTRYKLRLSANDPQYSLCRMNHAMISFSENGGITTRLVVFGGGKTTKVGNDMLEINIKEHSHEMVLLSNNMKSRIVDCKYVDITVKTVHA